MGQTKWYESERLRKQAADIVQLRAKGLTQQAIAERLNLTQGTVSLYLKATLGGATSFDELDGLTGIDGLARGVHIAVTNIVNSADLTSDEKVKKLDQAMADIAARLKKLGEEQPTGAKALAQDLLGSRKPKPTAGSKELRARSSPAAQHAADLLDGRVIQG